ncbi:MAG: methyltransferase domain-containing protein [Planctomycetes bacterium]|nr:methyltransferase domain-containing protein [Planctomycetota bacterium]MCH9726569.1 methyltransferase domain-containing protein [Planctomycetota bacterium]MCH9779238.1 methyltransferase domain-containing protein [Planctomycetota bacterium]MCH9790106.1 methyltransferase domain-containing protein [Planctomycetota bacterium]
MTRLTDQAHELIAAVLKPGETAIDATAGNGHDTLFLCQTVGPTGSVFAFDIQQKGLDQTIEKLTQAGFSNCNLVCHDHSQLAEIIPSNLHQRIGAIMFNLGYLPGGDHTIITQQHSTLTAVKAASKLLRPGGILTIMAYPGHPGGAAETTAVSEWINTLEENLFKTDICFSLSDSTRAPRLFVLRKQE